MNPSACGGDENAGLTVFNLMLSGTFCMPCCRASRGFSRVGGSIYNCAILFTKRTEEEDGKPEKDPSIQAALGRP